MCSGRGETTPVLWAVQAIPHMAARARHSAPDSQAGWLNSRDARARWRVAHGRDKLGGASMPDSKARCVGMCSTLRPRERVQNPRERRDDREVVARDSEGVFMGRGTSAHRARMASCACSTAETALERPGGR